MRKKVEQGKLEKQKAAQSKQEKLLAKELKQVLKEYDDLKRDQSLAGSGESFSSGTPSPARAPADAAVPA